MLDHNVLDHNALDQDFDADTRRRGEIRAGDGNADVEEEDVYRFRRKFGDDKLLQRRDERSLYLSGIGMLFWLPSNLMLLPHVPHALTRCFLHSSGCYVAFA